VPVIIPPDTEPAQTEEELVIDSTTVHADNTALSLENAAAGIRVVEMDFPPPSSQTITAGSIDTEGDPLVHSRVGNRTVKIVVRCEGTGAVGDPHAQMRERITALSMKVGKLHAERDLADPSRTGTLKRVLTNGDIVYFDILDASIEVPADWDFIHNDSVEVTLDLECRPFAWGAEETAGSFSETTLPEAVFTVADIKGDVPALGRLLIEDDSANDQWFYHWGVQPPAQYPGTATASTTAALGYQAEALTALNAATATALSAASGGTALKLADVGTGYQAILGTNLSGAALSHVGSYRVFARLMAGAGAGTAQAGTVSVRLEWRPSAAGKYTANDATTVLPADGGQIVYRDLGLVTIPRALTGAQQWDGRIVAKSTTATDDVWLDRVMLAPVDGGYGEAQMVPPTSETPATYVARDDFAAGTATLAGTVLTVGGTWSVAGGGTFTCASGSVTSSGTIAGTAIGVAGTATYANVAVSTEVSPLTEANAGVVARYSGTGDYLAAVQTVLFYAVPAFEEWPAGNSLSVFYAYKQIGGTAYSLLGGTGYTYGTAGTVAMRVDTAGRWYVSGTGGAVIMSGQDSDLAAGGTLASGKVGVIDRLTSGDTTAGTRVYDNFRAWEPEYDAAIFASKQSQVHHNRAEHQDSSGSAIARIADYQGDYLHIPPAGLDGGTSRFYVKASRNLPASMSDPGIDDISGTVYYTPRYWHIPE
jgi:hypothetical protein